MEKLRHFLLLALPPPLIGRPAINGSGDFDTKGKALQISKTYNHTFYESS